MWDFLRSIFCGDLQRQIEALESEVDRLSRELRLCSETLQDATEELAEKTVQITNLNGTINTLQGEIDSLESDIDQYVIRINALEEGLAKAVTIPDVSAFLEPRQVVKPFEHPELGRVDPDTHKMIYDLEVSDIEYYAFTKENWLQLLDLVKQEVKRVLGTSSIPMTDCDNYSELTSTICHKAFIDAGLDRHGAVFVAHKEGVHAYNGFIDTDGKVWIYDSMMLNSLIGELGSTPENLYKTTDIWFSG